MIIDTHLHMWELESTKYPWKPLGKIRPDYAWPAASGIAVMKKFGIDAGVLVQPSMYAYDNRYIVDSMNKYPELRTIGLIDPAADDVEKNMIDLIGKGVSGFRISPLMRPDIPWYSDRFWKKANETGCIITLLATLKQLDEAVPMIEKYPNVRVVVDHMAHPESEIGLQTEPFRNLLSWSKYSNVYIKVSALGMMSQKPFPHTDMQEFFKAIYQSFGPGRLIWGTDTPMSTSPDAVDKELAVAAMMMEEIPEKDKNKILGGTAKTLFKF